MCSITQLSLKEHRARHKWVQLLMKKIQLTEWSIKTAHEGVKEEMIKLENTMKLLFDVKHNTMEF